MKKRHEVIFLYYSIWFYFLYDVAYALFIFILINKDLVANKKKY